MASLKFSLFWMFDSGFNCNNANLGEAKTN